jgi:carbon storage regulator CsrA
MLVLNRHHNQGVVITTPEGREIRVVVLEPRDGQTRLGFLADREVTIHRAEIDEKIKAKGGVR